VESFEKGFGEASILAAMGTGDKVYEMEGGEDKRCGGKNETRKVGHKAAPEPLGATPF